jgi:hypothetical protein
VSAPADILWSALLSDKKELDRYLGENKKRLGETYDYATRCLEKKKIPFRPASAGHFVMSAFFLNASFII